MDWLKTLAPTAATLLGGPLAGLAVKAIGDAIGLSDATKETITEVLQSGNMTAEQVAAIKHAEHDLKVKLKELDIKVEEIAAADRASARQMQMSTRSWVPALLSVATVSGFFILLGGAASGHFTLTGSDVMMLLLGVLARETASVYQFWLGSSSGSQHKTDMLGK
jgi:hypothetical protein